MRGSSKLAASSRTRMCGVVKWLISVGITVRIKSQKMIDSRSNNVQHPLLLVISEMIKQK